MLRKDLKVKRPEGTKVYRKGTNVYVYHTVDSVYKKEKQYVVESRVCIGKMLDEEYMMPNENYMKHYSFEGVEEKEQEYSEALQIATMILLKKIMEDLGLTEILREVYEEQADLLQDLVSYMIIRQTSTMHHYADFAFVHMQSSKKIRDDSRITELFKTRIGVGEVEEFQRKWNERQTEKAGVYVGYDSTNMNTKAQGIEMAEYGHAKEKREIPQVNISYAVKQSDATPLFYEMYPGSIIDNSQCTYMVDRMRSYGYQSVGFVLDRGYVSLKNIRYFDENNYDFVMMMKLNTKATQEYLKKALFELRMKNEYYIPENGVNGMTFTGKLWETDTKTRYIHIYYDNVRGNEERNRYLDQVQEKQKQLEQKVAEKLHTEDELGAYKQTFRLKLDSYGYLESYTRDEKKIKEQTDTLGFFILVTSAQMSATEALQIYRDRDSTEKLFRALKTGLEYDTYRVHSQKSLAGKTHVMFIASIVRNRLFQVLKANRGMDKKNFTVPAALSELEKVVAIKDNKDGKYVRRYGLTSKQKKILRPFGIDNKYLDKILLDF